MRRLTRMLFLVVLGSSALGTRSNEPPIAPGDPRDGYEGTTFQTDSRQISTVHGKAAGLARLVVSPPLGLPPLPVEYRPAPKAIDLGRKLFFDRRLSANATLSCAMCHIPEQGFAQNELRTPVGIEGRFVHRNAPSLYNVAYLPVLFHDGRERRLEQQIWAPLLADNEMGNATRSALLARLQGLDDYASEFRAVFADGLNESTLGLALASYQRALLSADSAFDRWYFGGDSQATSAAAKRGFALFVRSGCATCHQVQVGHALFTDNDFHDTGIGYRAAQRGTALPDRVQLAPGVFVEIDADLAVPRIEDLGRMGVTADPADRWRYRTPSLRNVALTAPYMHDGSIANLAEVVDFYAAGGIAHEGLDPALRPLPLTGQDRADLVSFLTSLTGSNVAALAADARTTPIGEIHREP